jgi:hypothetical protein
MSARRAVQDRSAVVSADPRARKEPAVRSRRCEQILELIDKALEDLPNLQCPEQDVPRDQRPPGTQRGDGQDEQGDERAPAAA